MPTRVHSVLHLEEKLASPQRYGERVKPYRNFRSRGNSSRAGRWLTRHSSASMLLGLDQKTGGRIHQSIHLPDEIPAFLTSHRTSAVYTAEANARSVFRCYTRFALPRRAVSKWTCAYG